MSDFRNQLELRVFHLKRGGGHAVIQWLAACSGRPTVHLNNAFSKPWKVRLRGERVFRRVLTGEPPEHQPSVHGFDIAGMSAKDLARAQKDVLIYNLENFPLSRVAAEPLLNGGQQAILGTSRSTRTVLILRDAPNTFASVRRGKWRMRRRLKRFYAEQWKVYAREYLGDTSMLPVDTLRISFNRWFVEPSYRLELARELGFTRSDAGLDQVPSFGGGSSFSGTAFAGRASEMKVLDRWQELLEDGAYRSALDRETLELSQRIFGDVTAGRVPLPPA